METTATKTIIDRLKEFNPAVEKFIELGDHDDYSVSYDMYDKSKIEVYFDNNLTSNCLSVIYDNDNGDYFLLHFDDNTGAYYLLLAHYQTILCAARADCFSVKDFVDIMGSMNFTYSRY